MYSVQCSAAVLHSRGSARQAGILWRACQGSWLQSARTGSQLTTALLATGGGQDEPPRADVRGGAARQHWRRQRQRAPQRGGAQLQVGAGSGGVKSCRLATHPNLLSLSQARPHLPQSRPSPACHCDWLPSTPAMHPVCPPALHCCTACCCTVHIGLTWHSLYCPVLLLYCRCTAPLQGGDCVVQRPHHHAQAADAAGHRGGALRGRHGVSAAAQPACSVRCLLMVVMWGLCAVAC